MEQLLILDPSSCETSYVTNHDCHLASAQRQAPAHHQHDQGEEAARASCRPDHPCNGLTCVQRQAKAGRGHGGADREGGRAAKVVINQEGEILPQRLPHLQGTREGVLG